MKNSDFTNLQGAAPRDMGFSPWERLKTKRISYLTLPLLVMATIMEFVILATGWRYQKTVCLPPGMGVTFFGIGPIGATILAVELLKLPLAIWTASRHGFQKWFMLVIGLPCICVLTFQLVKDMAVYEMGVAMTPASQMLEKAMTEEVKISQLNGELAAIEQKRGDREHRLADLAAKQAKAKAELQDSLKRNEEARQDAISLTDYQKKELSEVEARQANIIQQFNSDTEQLTKAIADLRARREAEFARSSKDSKDWESRKAGYDAAYAKWHTEEARIDNVYQTAMADYANKKAAYEKEKADYAAAGFLKRQLMKEPLDPGVPPVREANQYTKPAELDGRPSALVAEIDDQIKAKEAELLAVNNKRRDRVAQVDADARRLREEFDHRSVVKREESDHKREELSTAVAALATEEKAQREAIDKEFQSVVEKTDGFRAEIDAARKRAEGFYEAREAAIRKTQVHRIATTVEIVRGLIKGERPVSIKATAKERGDLLTDQISMVRIWVYPVLAFIVAFLPTLMVEIGFSTVFEPDKQRPPYRIGFLGRGLHWLYIRAGRQKILRAERIASEASTEIALRDRALAEARGAADKALFDKDAELQSIREAMSVAVDEYQQKSKRREAEYAEQARKKEDEWVLKLANMADSLNRTVVEKDALRDLQKSEIERQIALRQNAWSDRLTQLRQELDDQRTASETERTTLMQEHHKKLMELSEECKNQVIQARRQVADAELGSVEATARLTNDLKEALQARDNAEDQLQQQSNALSLKLSQAKEDAARELEKAVRQEKHRSERQQLEFTKALRQREEDFERHLQQREQELSLAFDARLAEEQAKLEQDARRRETELEQQFEGRGLEVDSRWKQEMQKREEAALVRLKQREQQVLAQAEARLSEIQTRTEQDLRRREAESQRQLDALSREAETRLKQELQQKELSFQAKLKQREQELALSADARQTELQNQFAAELRSREEASERQGKVRFSEIQSQAEQELRRRQAEFERQLETQSREAETRLKQDSQQKEVAFQARLKQREQELAIGVEAKEAEFQNKKSAELRARELEWERQGESRVRAAETRLAQDAQQKEELFQTKLRQRDQQWQVKLDAARAELHVQTEALRRREADSDAALRNLEARLRNEMQQKDEAAHAMVEKREQELIAQLTAQAEARYAAAQAQWESEAEKRARAAIEPFKALLARTEKERDEARQYATDNARQVQTLEKQLTEASSFLSGWRNGKNLAGTA